MLGLGPREIIILAAILLLLFGSKKIPELTRSIGEAIRHIRNGFSDVDKNLTTTEEKEVK
ncbi:twin-arginine translocase TatA/TatE family subunit [Candidatus Wolfebacteria bacterium]|nr:MAG: twin-arginine translocase TatA/TatE family subunit [Candidatus Wolfebacteria bacterium]